MNMNVNAFSITSFAGDAVYAPNVIIGGARLVKDLAKSITAPTPLKLVSGNNKQLFLDVAEAGDTIFGVLKREPQKSTYKGNDVVGFYRANDIIFLEADVDVKAGEKVYFTPEYKITPTEAGSIGVAGLANTDAGAGENSIVTLSCQYALA